jgi:hypothetical protein
MKRMTSVSDEKSPDLITAEDEALGPCTVCGGKKSEHENTIHAFTNIGGVLVTRDAVKKAEEKQKPIVIAGPQSQNMTRLLETLSSKGVLDDNDLLYITGLKGRSDGDGS